MKTPIGHKIWAIPEGYIPGKSTGEGREFTSHETVSILNTGEQDANVEIFIYFADKDPVGPYKIKVQGQRTLHLWFNDLKEPEEVPKDTDYASVIKSDVPIVVQHTRIDTRQAENALLSTIAYPVQ